MAGTKYQFWRKSRKIYSIRLVQAVITHSTSVIYTVNLQESNTVLYNVDPTLL